MTDLTQAIEICKAIKDAAIQGKCLYDVANPVDHSWVALPIVFIVVIMGIIFLAWIRD